MKRKILLFVIFVIVFVLALVLILFSINTESFDYDNTVTINSTVTRQYSEEKIQKLQSDIWANDITFRQFNIKYNPQCIRQTSQGYYYLYQIIF